jgi:hypothetical protein
MVKLAGQSHKVLAVVIRQGEQVAQLEGVKELIPSHRLER